jgi:hypothetical protein
LTSTTSTRPPASTPLRATPNLERLLGRLRARLGVLAWMQGAGVVLAMLCAWLAFAFLADWALQVPRGVRWFHLGLCVLVPSAALWRFGVRPWLRRPDRAGLAVLLERERPQTRQLLVSAVQLQQAPPADAHPELVERVLRDAEMEAARTKLDGVLDPRRPRQLLALGVASALAVSAAARAWPEYASIFAARLLGSNEPWPQLTVLELALGAGLESVPLETTADGVLARLPRGVDAPIVVRAVGVRPREVRLHLGGNAAIALGSGPDGVYRTVLRSLSEDVTLYATGGDDRDGKPRLTLVVLEPPDVAALAITVTPPAYTALPERVEYDRDVEVLAGSRVAVAVRPSPADARGTARILPADQLIPLEARAFPSDPVAVEGQDATGGATNADAAGGADALGFEFLATQSFRYRIELVDAAGLSNPDPGLFAIQVLRDERPQVEWLAPARNEIETLERGVVRLLARVEDDFGVAGVQWRARRAATDEAPAWNALETVAAPTSEGDRGASNSRLAGVRVEVAALGADSGALQAGDQIEFELRAFDARPPLSDGELDSAGVTTPTPLRVRVVSEDDLLRRLQDRLARARVQAADLETLARERLRRTSELLRALESDQGAAGAGDMTGLVSGQRRVQGDLDSLSREFASIVENVLYARLDEAAAGALADLDARLAQASARSFSLEMWRDFAAGVRTGQVLAPGLAAQLTGLMERSVELSVTHSPQATDALDRGARAGEVGAAHAALTEAHAAQEQVQRGLSELLEQLAEWDNFQAVLTLTRDILNRQKSVRDRTRDASGDDPRSKNK